VITISEAYVVQLNSMRRFHDDVGSCL